MGHLNSTEWSIHLQWLDYLIESFPLTNLNGIIYLQAEPTICIERVKQRNRSEESNVPEDYIKSLHNAHQQWLDNSSKPSSTPVLVVDCNYNFESDKTAALNATESVKAFVNHLRHEKMLDFEW